MIDFSKVNEGFDLKQIVLSKIGEEEILERYIGELNFNSPILSPLRKERNPSFTIKRMPDNKIIWRDWGIGLSGDCFKLVQELYGCDFHEALKIIMSDFKIKRYDYNGIINSNFTKVSKETVRKETYIFVEKQPFRLSDRVYWHKFGISLNTLAKYNVHSAKNIWLFKDDKLTYHKEYTTNCPIYAYQFNSYKTENYKIYTPFAEKKFKWLFSGQKEDIEGFDQLPLKDTLLVLTKSLKDVMAYNELNYSAISLQGEHNKLEEDLLDKLYMRFDNIIVNYDNDLAGIKAAEALNKKYGLSCFVLNEGKDLSGYIEINGKHKAKEMLYNIIGM